MSSPQVSVCMPAARGGALFEQALRSVLAQPVDDLEVVVSDDSGGALREVVDRVADERVRYLANPAPLGFARNHVHALNEARGRYVAVLHDDDRYLPGFLRTALGRFADDPSLGVVCADCWLETDGQQHSRRQVPFRGGRHDRWLPLVISHGVFLPSTTVLRREVWEGTARSWPDNNVADVTLFIDAALAGWPMYWVDEPLVIYRVHSGQISADDLHHRDGLVQLWSAYSFEDPEAEHLRKGRMADWLIARAGLRLRRGERALARADLARARATRPDFHRPRRIVLTVLARVPVLLPVARRVHAWRRGTT